MKKFSALMLLYSYVVKHLMAGATPTNLYERNPSQGPSDSYTFQNGPNQVRRDVHVDFSSTFLPESCLLQAQSNDQLSVLYVGTFPNGGKRFDAIEDRNNPFVFTLSLGQVIKGWDQGLVGMCEGEKRTLKIPAELAYGHAGAGDDIPPDSPLEFQVELIKILKREDKSTHALKELEIEVVNKPLSCRIKSKDQDTLKMIYVGTLRSTGLQFDSATDPKHPFEFKLGVGEVIKGWDQGLKDMCIKEKRRLLIPARLSYGHNGFSSSNPPIPPDADLVFHVELIDIQNENDSKSSNSNFTQQYPNQNSPWIRIWSVFESLTFIFEWMLIFF